MWYNTNFHTSLNTTPYEVVYGQAPPLHVPYIPSDSLNAAVGRSLSAREQILQQAKEQLARAQNMMKQMADRNRFERSFEEGDWFYLKLQPYRQFSITQRHTDKLSAKYCGPFLILEKVGSVSYKLQFSSGAKIHDTIHVSLLKRVGQFEQGERVLKEPPECLRKTNFQTSLETERILERKYAKKQNKTVIMWLIKWNNRPEEDSTWEEAEEFKKNYPNFNYSS